MIGRVYQNRKNGQYFLTLRKKELNFDFINSNPKAIEIKAYKLITKKNDK